MIPVLTGERIALRGFTWADFPDYARIWSDPGLTPFLPFAPIAPEDCWARMNKIAWHWSHHGFGNFAITDRAGGRFLGHVGLFRADRGVGPDFDHEPEAGWVLDRAARGRGIATEALALVLDWFDRQPAAGRVVCMMDVAHAGSIRVAEKNGFRRLRIGEDAWGKVQIMERPAPV